MTAAAGVALRARPHWIAPEIHVDAKKLRARIEALSVFGRPEGGTFADGVSRVAYSQADVDGRRFVMREMRAARLTPRIDPAGNIFARRAGANPGLPPILFGSHIDSVPNGGNFDGDLGVLSSLGVIEALERAAHSTRHPLEMVIWACEEGVAFGRGLASSRIVAGDITTADLSQVWNGMTRAQAISQIGGDPAHIMEAVQPKGAYHGYLELHIEQGGTLEQRALNVGVVEGIVGIHRFDAIVTGFANHAGTTPMPERQDALLAASHLTIAVREAVTREPGRQVGTVGHIEVTPNAPNVIPGHVKMTIELRDLSVATLTRLADDIRRRASEIAQSTKTTIEIKPLSMNPPALATPAVQAAIERAAGSLALTSTRMPSGAGHDAQMMAHIAPMGMIFVPSVGGISHSPRELTHWDDCARGADMLLHAILELDAA